MDEERDPHKAQMVALAAMAMALCIEAAGYMRWLQRRVWMVRGIVLLNVACVAWNASLFRAEFWWLPALGVAGNVWAIRKCLQTEIEIQGDIKNARARLRDVQQKIERVRNENRA